MTEKQFDALCKHLNVPPEQLTDPLVIEKAALDCKDVLGINPPYKNPYMEKRMQNMVDIMLSNVLFPDEEEEKRKTPHKRKKTRRTRTV